MLPPVLIARDSAFYAADETYSTGHSRVAYIQRWVVLLTLQGECRYFHQSKNSDYARGDLLVIRPDTEIAWQVTSTEPWRVVYAVFHPRTHWYEWLLPQNFETGVTSVSIHDATTLARLQHGLLGVYRIYARGLMYRDEWMMAALERVLLTLHTYITQEKAPLDPRVQNAMRFIHDQYTRQLTNQDIAKAAHSSSSHLSLLFSQQVGMSPMQYLEQLRLQRAAEMLRFGSQSIHEVMIASGYRDAAYFSNRFRRYKGISPRDYRKKSHSEIEDGPL